MLNIMGMEYYSDGLEFDDDFEDEFYEEFILGESEDDDIYEYKEFESHVVEKLPYCNLGVLDYPYFQLTCLNDEIVLN